MINAIKLARLRNSANMAFHFEVVALIIEFAAARLNIVALFNVYQAAVTRLDEAYKKIVKSNFTEEIKAADKARDTLFSSIAAIVKTAIKHYNQEVVKAAKRLKKLLDTYGKVNQKSYSEQTADIINIMQEFRGAYADDVALLRITEMVDELERANNAFEALVVQRDVEAAAKNPDKMKDARAAADKAYHDIVERINAAVVMEGPENYAAFITRLNLLVDKYKLLITKSHHHAKKEEGEVVEAKD